MILSYEIDTEWIELNHLAEYLLCRKSFRSRVITQTYKHTHTHTHTHRGPITLPGPLTGSVTISVVFCLIHVVAVPFPYTPWNSMEKNMWNFSWKLRRNSREILRGITTENVVFRGDPMEYFTRNSNKCSTKPIPLFCDITAHHRPGLTTYCCCTDLPLPISIDHPTRFMTY